MKKLKAYNEKLLDSDIEKHNKIVSLEMEIEKLKMEELRMAKTIYVVNSVGEVGNMFDGSIEKYTEVECAFNSEDEAKMYCNNRNAFPASDVTYQYEEVELK